MKITLCRHMKTPLDTPTAAFQNIIACLKRRLLHNGSKLQCQNGMHKPRSQPPKAQATSPLPGYHHVSTSPSSRTQPHTTSTAEHTSWWWSYKTPTTPGQLDYFTWIKIL
ncbi:hypothetical protein TNCT_533161 [Trichonephila clavata]|uniref:Uncharacterized protein n=1 Tax=Trichonephila clavata TaxID=2740835 RepID=A0A8X6FDY7_TRICU|nr:hypothetical protein TNCT_533161 [Trichonephila clavata]